MKLQQGEQLIKQQENAVWVRGTFNSVVGTLILTNQRLAFEQRSVIRSSILGQLGVAGTLADEALPRNLVVNLPLGSLASFAPPKVVSSRKVLPIFPRNGEELLFSGPKFEQWRPALLQAGLSDAGQPSSVPGATSYGQPSFQGQQLAYSGGHAPPQPHTQPKTGIPWWGWLLIVGGVVILACGALVIALAALGSVVSSTIPGSVAATLGWSLRMSSGMALTGIP